MDIRGADMVSNIDFIVARPGQTESECKVKEAAWVQSQAYFEALRYYPSPSEVRRNGETPATWSGNTHGPNSKVESLECHVRTRLGLGPAPEWSEDQLQHHHSPNVTRGLRNALALKRAMPKPEQAIALRRRQPEKSSDLLLTEAARGMSTQLTKGAKLADPLDKDRSRMW